MVLAKAMVKAEAPSCARLGQVRRAADAQSGALASALALPASFGRAYRSCREASDLPGPG
jgi:hypothetical protein